jgi:hypothetical protein
MRQNTSGRTKRILVITGVIGLLVTAIAVVLAKGKNRA